MKFHAIIFDFDGVIVDSEMVANSAMAQVLTDLGFTVTADEAIARYSGLRWSDCHRLIKEDSGLTMDADQLGRVVDEAVAARAGDVLAVEGLDRFLEAHKHKRLAIASSSHKQWLDAMLERLALSAHFEDRVFSAAGFPRGKPHPDIYLHVAERMGVAPSDCLVIEDHPVGVAAGAAAGMTVIALLAASHIQAGHSERVRKAGAHYVARDYEEAARLVTRLEQGG